MTAVKQLKLDEHLSHLSTGGGASLELIEGKGMPGLRALVDDADSTAGTAAAAATAQSSHLAADVLRQASAVAV